MITRRLAFGAIGCLALTVVAGCGSGSTVASSDLSTQKTLACLKQVTPAAGFV
jgi:hypothetical protein